MGRSRPRFLRKLSLPLAVLSALLSSGDAFGQVEVKFANGELEILGTGDNDRIVIARFGPLLVVVGRDGRGNVTRRVVWPGQVGAIVVNARPGDDVIANLTSIPSRVQGGRGDDLFIGGTNADRYQDWGGRDFVVERDGANWINGGDDADFLMGGRNLDILEGEDGSDVLWGRQEHNLMTGGQGGDLIVGGPDQDEITGDAGSDSLWGLAGKDGLSGGDGDDLLCGGPQSDVLSGDNGNDYPARKAANLDPIEALRYE